MAKLRRIVLDTLKPHQPSIVPLSQQLADLRGVTAVNISVYEMDHRVENVKVTIEGEDLDFERITALIEDSGGAIHSVDEVVAGKEIIDDPATPQD